MASADLSKTPVSARARQITDADVPEVVDLLTRGFVRDRTHEFWADALQCMGKRAVPEGYPRYGFLMESNNKIVGVILLIFSTLWQKDKPTIRCNVTSWYVEPAFRSYAPMLASQAPKYKNATILNVSASPHTHLMVAAWKFTRYSNGVFASVPLLSSSPENTSVRVIDGREQPDAPFDPHEHQLLMDHLNYGCSAVWCVTPERAYPFVFRSRPIKTIIPCVQLIYCPSIEDFVRFARPIGMHLTRRLVFLVLLDANEKIPGLVGKYHEGKNPKYFLGPNPPRMGDIAYTESSLFGVY